MGRPGTLHKTESISHISDLISNVKRTAEVAGSGELTVGRYQYKLVNRRTMQAFCVELENKKMLLIAFR